MDKPLIGQHTSSQFDAELDDVRARVMAMGGLVEQQLADAMRSFVQRDTLLADDVIARDRRVNDSEVAIDEECSRILALRQPTARDLRLIYAIIKTITDLERIGDEARKIARMALDLGSQERIRAEFAEVQHLAEQVAGMVHRTLDSFARMDAEAALRVTRQDEVVDREYEALMRQCVTFMMEDPRTIRRVMDIVWCVRSLERIGDHSKNIAEYVVYLVKGKDVRHLSLESMEKHVHG